jgi:PilZ domain
MSDAFDIFNKTPDGHPDSRRSKRVALKTRGSLVVTNDYENPRRLPCLIVDASQWGFRVRVAARLRRGQVVEVVSDDDPLTSVGCRVAWVGKTESNEQGEAGLQIG